MENNRNWAGTAALVLAGLALFVALGGRFGPNFDFSAHVWSGGPDAQAVPPGVFHMEPQGGVIVVPPVAPAVPAAPVAPVAPAAPVAPVAPVAPIKPGASAAPFKGYGPFMHGDYGQGRWGSVAGPFRMMAGLVQLLIFGAVLFVIFRFFRRRRQAFARGPAQGPPPPTPPGETPTIQL